MLATCKRVWLQYLRMMGRCRSLLLSPTWLENKTHWHGPVAVAQDFTAAVGADSKLAPICTLLMQVLSPAVLCACC